MIFFSIEIPPACLSMYHGSVFFIFDPFAGAVALSRLMVTCNSPNSFFYNKTKQLKTPIEQLTRGIVIPEATQDSVRWGVPRSWREIH